jgi:hypothetical protein
LIYIYECGKIDMVIACTKGAFVITSCKPTSTRRRDDAVLAEGYSFIEGSFTGKVLLFLLSNGPQTDKVVAKHFAGEIPGNTTDQLLMELHQDGMITFTETSEEEVLV